MLTYIERKARVPHGAGIEVSKKLGCAPSTVTHVLKGVHRNREIEVELARLMRPRTSVREAFGPPGPERIKPPRQELAAAS